MIYEYRAYYIMPGRMPDIQRRFADHTMRLFKKHGIGVVGFWETVFGESNELVYICSYEDLAHPPTETEPTERGIAKWRR